MLGPLRLEREEPLVHRLQGFDLRVGELGMRRDDEVDVAVLVGVADSEGTLEVGAAEVLGEGGLDTRDELAENVVELGKGGRCRSSHLEMKRRACMPAFSETSLKLLVGAVEPLRAAGHIGSVLVGGFQVFDLFALGLLLLVLLLLFH